MNQEADIQVLLTDIHLSHILHRCIYSEKKMEIPGHIHIPLQFHNTNVLLPLLHCQS